jgi:uncharacterized membrane protein (UPF0127 family)
MNFTLLNYYFIICISLLLLSCGSPPGREEIPFTRHGVLSITQLCDLGAVIDTLYFEVELAEDTLSQSRGLMNRFSLGQNQGMLFIFDYEDYQVFWMRDTFISLDIIFICSDLIINEIYENAFPLSEELIISRYLSKYVLEILGGQSSTQGISVGNKISLIRD